MATPRVLVPLCLLALMTGCGAGEDPAGSGGVRVVATTTQAADLARAVAGGRAGVTGLIPANADPHDYEVRPADVKALASADLVVRSGGDVDDWLEQAIESAGSGVGTLVLIDRVRTIAGEGSEPDPHWWQDPRNAARAVGAIRDELTGADPEGGAEYARNATAYSARLSALDGAVAACLDRIPAAQRKLVTTHDALGYYADHYGLEVIGAVIPSRSTQAQASAGELTELTELIERERVKAIFAESSVDGKLERTVAEQAGARLGEALWADSLGPEGSDGDTYVKAIAANTRAIAGGLSDGRVSCALPG